MGPDGHRDWARDEIGITLMNLRDLKLRARALLAPRRVERELDEELIFHIERETQVGSASGPPIIGHHFHCLASSVGSTRDVKTQLASTSSDG